MALAFRAVLGMLKLRFQWELAFRADALLAMLGSFLAGIGGIMLFEVIFAQVEAIGGWERPQVLALVGTLLILVELERGLFRGIQRRLPDLVGEGQLEQYLLRPLPAPLLLAFRNATLNVIWRLPLGVAVLAYALTQADFASWRLPLYLVSLGMSLGIYLLMVFCLVSLSFWLIEMHNLFWVVYDLTEFSRYPASVYRGPVRVVLTTVLPFVVLASFPVEFLLRQGSLWLLAHQGAVLLAFALLGWALWRLGLRRYQGAST